MDINKLFKGIAVVIDNEIKKEQSEISRIVEIIQSKNIPVSLFDDIPNTDIIPALSNAAFIILDWDFNDISGLVDDEERIGLPETLSHIKEQELIGFINELIHGIFVPTFIFYRI